MCQQWIIPLSIISIDPLWLYDKKGKLVCVFHVNVMLCPQLNMVSAVVLIHGILTVWAPCHKCYYKSLVVGCQACPGGQIKRTCTCSYPVFSRLFGVILPLYNCSSERDPSTKCLLILLPLESSSGLLSKSVLQRKLEWCTLGKVPWEGGSQLIMLPAHFIWDLKC